jgi:crotonobetaine/carnitine-CoA ligase
VSGLLAAGPSDPRVLLDAIPFEQRTLAALLDARTPAADPYLEIEGRRLRWAELAELVQAQAAKLAAVGVGRGDIVCQVAGNSLAHVVTVLAIARLGAVECPVNTALKGTPLKHVLRDSGATVVIAEAAYLDLIRDACRAVARPVILVARGADALPVGGAVRVVREEELAGGAVSPADVAPADPATIMYTSGTTGPAKGVVLPHHFAFSAAAVKVGVWGLGPDDVLFTALPLFHSNARYSTLLTSAIAGCRAVIVERFSASRFWEQVRSAGATEVATVGTLAPILMERPPSAADRDHSVRMMHGAGALPLERRAAFEQRFGIRLVTGFAMTETSHFSTASPDDEDRHAASGRPVPGFTVGILDEHGQALETGRVGEIAVRPAIPYSMFLGYHRQPEATLAAFRGLWFHTGDLGYLDDRGLLHWTDRLKDAIRRKGEMISSQDVEAAALQFGAVAEAAAVGVPGALGEQEVKLFVRPADGERVDFPALRGHCEGALPAFAVPRFYAAIDQFPKTSTHKIDKKRLLALAGGEVWDATP